MEEKKATYEWPPAIEGFHVMEWLRGVRDANYERLGHLETGEFIHQLSQEGMQVPGYREMAEKSARRKEEREKQEQA